MPVALLEMVLKIVFRAKARKDVANAVTWYEARRSGLGEQFLLEMQRCLGSIAMNPARFPSIHPSFRQAPMRRFPYVVVYRPLKNEVVIMRVFHTKQDPKKKLGKR